ncbi:hypothetical protein DAPPUDRAFT_326825 [Daphnia pulex]|uniref:RNase III domain-containing protein n=1 Tax=Daphnia pulex TaxID=6669 RepID=E9H8W2_DAPPU|nr:hypothetical protein DAPPUDRAFT_326825 [Daphnia pulex]|eukprot:EFX71789.1 hypothetical protein DAPPUDRAFT_326825 [Daphnia pulex]
MSGVEIVPPSAVPLLDPEILATAVENPLPETDAALVVLEKILGYEFQNKDNLKLALTHTISNPTKCPSKDSDRSESLGDKFLGALIMVNCYKTYPTYGAGELANLTSMITCNDTFAVLAVPALIPTTIPGERISIEIDYPKVYADLFEAVAASIYVDCNEDFNTFRRVFFAIMRETIDNFMTNNLGCPISLSFANARGQKIIYK